jgi:hypothetical protein
VLSLLRLGFVLLRAQRRRRLPPWATGDCLRSALPLLAAAPPPALPPSSSNSETVPILEHFVRSEFSLQSLQQASRWTLWPQLPPLENAAATGTAVHWVRLTSQTGHQIVLCTPVLTVTDVFRRSAFAHASSCDWKTPPCAS